MQGCKSLNLSKKSKQNCDACYEYLLQNCEDIVKKDTAKQSVQVTVLGENLTDTLYLTSICDSLKKGLFNNKILFHKKKGNLNMKVTINKNGKAAIECESDTVIKQVNVAIPCNCVFTKKDLTKYVKTKIGNYWKTWRWWIAGILILASIVWFLIWKNKK